MTDDTDGEREAARQQILQSLERLRKDSLLDDLKHMSLSDIVQAVEKELKELDLFFHQKIEAAALPIADSKLLRSGRSAIARSAAIVCSHLSEFESACLKHSGGDQETLKKASDWILEGLISEVEKFAKALQFDGWSLTVSAGLPAGVSFSVTFSFK